MKNIIIGASLAVIGVLVILFGDAVRVIQSVVGETARGQISMLFLFVLGVFLLVYGIYRIFKNLRK